MKVFKGTTRVVYLIGKYAFKFPRVHHWKSFLKGILANIDEHYWYKHSPEQWKRKMCPVIFKSWWGILLIMTRAIHLEESEYNKEQFAEDFKDIPLSLDNKIINFGKLKDNTIVLVDYADTRYMCSDCSYLIKCCQTPKP